MAPTPHPFLIIETGQPIASLRRHRGFPHWIRVAAGLHRDAAVVVDVEHGDSLPSSEGFAGVIITGSGAMVTQRLDWSERSAAWLHDAAHAGLPIFGICYGHQLLAHALGGEVGDNPAGREMGTVELSLLPSVADDPLFAGLPPQFRVQATHLQSVLSEPEGATLLATTALDPRAAFRWRECAWGVQFHPEFNVTHLRGYVRARCDAIENEGLDADAMLRGLRSATHGRQVLRSFVRHAAGLRRIF